MGEINWSDLKKRADDATKPAPPGTYVVEIKKASWKNNSAGDPMYSLQAVIVDGASEGKTVFSNLTLKTDNNFTLSMFFRHMEALGLNDQFFASGPGHDQVCSALVGRRAHFILDVRQWQGRDRNNLVDIKPLSGPLAAMSGRPSTSGIAPSTSSVTSASSVPVASAPTAHVSTPQISMNTSPSAGLSVSVPTPPPSPFDITPSSL